jgi:stearoyl-CoA desaturase (delta-9 desaturase)
LGFESIQLELKPSNPQVKSSQEVEMPERALTDQGARPDEFPLLSINTRVPENPEVAVPQISKEIPTIFQMGRTQNESGVVWITAIFMAIFHLGAIAALFFFSWTNLIVAAVLYVLAVNCGIGMGYHRLLVHRGYQVPKVVEYFLTICGTLALEGGPIAWVATHRIHHQHSDKVGDPHTPQEGTWWAHMGWIITGRALNTETEALAHYAPDLAKDRVQVWLSKYHWVPLTLLGIGLLLGGTFIEGSIRAGVGLFLWGIFLRVTLGLHATWLVNSATHLHGGRRFATRDESRNSWWVALLTGGEGWHNNHHAHPVSARHGLAWYEFDPNYYGIWLLEKLRLAKNVRIAKFTRRNPDHTVSPTHSATS